MRILDVVNLILPFAFSKQLLLYIYVYIDIEQYLFDTVDSLHSRHTLQNALSLSMVCQPKQ